VIERVVDDVLDRVVVLLLGLDHPRPEALAEDVVLGAVPCVEGFGVLAVEVAHPVREVGGGRLDEQVVVVAHEAPDVEAPAVPPLHRLRMWMKAVRSSESQKIGASLLPFVPTW
jgi:hypothetical protein